MPKENQEGNIQSDLGCAHANVYAIVAGLRKGCWRQQLEIADADRAFDRLMRVQKERKDFCDHRTPSKKSTDKNGLLKNQGDTAIGGLQQ